MLGLFKQLTVFFKFDSVRIDNNVFRLHYKGTVMVFVLASLLVTSRQYIGDPIDCIVDGVPGNVMDTYCWIHSTYSVPSRWVGEQGNDNAHPGISPLADLSPGTEVKYHKYYQWVCFFLFLQAILFYIPRYIWKSSEGNKIKMLVQGLQNPMIESTDKDDQISIIVKYFSMHRGTHTLYSIRFFFCEFLNLVNVLCQIYFIDYFLDYEFTQYGTAVLAYSESEPENRPDPMAKVFPKVTKCTFKKYGPSGTVELKDGLCVLPLNIINEKIFIFVWFWLVVVAIVTALFLFYRLVVIFSPSIRASLLEFRCGRASDTSRHKITSVLERDSLTRFEKLGDWLVLYLLFINLDVLLCKDLMAHLYKNEIGNENEMETLKLPSSNQSSSV